MTDTITLPRETVQQALEALEYMHNEKCDYMRRNNLGDPLRESATRLALPAITTLRAALQQAEPQAQAGEPKTAGWMRVYMGVFGGFRKNPDVKFSDGDYALRAALPQAEPCPESRGDGHACKNRHQCWEPCGELGKSEEHANVYEPQVQAGEKNENA